MYHVAGPARSCARRSLPDLAEGHGHGTTRCLPLSTSQIPGLVLNGSGNGGGNLATSMDPPPHHAASELARPRRRSPTRASPGTAAVGGPRPEPNIPERQSGRLCGGGVGRGLGLRSVPVQRRTISHSASTMSDDGMNIDDGMFSDMFILASHSQPVCPGGVVRRKGRGFQSVAGAFN